MTMIRWPANCEWSAVSLVEGYKRCIVGFDYRAWQNQKMLPIPVFDQYGEYRLWMQSREMFPATVDDLVWPCKITENFLLEENRNGFNLYQEWPSEWLYEREDENSLRKERKFYLYQMLFEKLNIKNPPKDSILVSFDCPLALVNTVKDPFGINPLSVDLMAQDGKWFFIGYDVADIRTFCSGFYSFDWTETEFDDLCGQQTLTLNSRGLIDDELLAIKSSVYFEHLVPEHAPFVPCGIWVYVSDHNL